MLGSRLSHQGLLLCSAAIAAVEVPAVPDDSEQNSFHATNWGTAEPAATVHPPTVRASIICSAAALSGLERVTSASHTCSRRLAANRTPLSIPLLRKAVARPKQPPASTTRMALLLGVTSPAPAAGRASLLEAALDDDADEGAASDDDFDAPAVPRRAAAKAR